jgi:DNA-binding NarL/FixJ family response regulator
VSPERSAIRVLIIDDHDMFRVGLCSMLAERDGLEVVAQASGGRMGVRLAEAMRPDVILMDLRMPDLNGMAATRAILEKDPTTLIIALTVSTKESDVAAAVAAGVCGYVMKDEPVEDIVGAINAAVSGAAWLSPRAARAVLEQMRSSEARGAGRRLPQELLSPREVEVLQLLARGLDNAQIASELSISPRTAKTHVSNILGKLNVGSRVEAAVYATRTGII